MFGKSKVILGVFLSALIGATSIVVSAGDDTSVYHPNVKQKNGNSTIKVEEVNITSDEISVDIKLTRPMINGYSDEHKFISFQVWNDSGLMLIPSGSASSGKPKGDKIVYSATENLQGYSGKLENLIIKPVIKKYKTPNKESMGINERTAKPVPIDQKHIVRIEQFPIVLSQGKAGSVQITDVEYLNDKTLVNINYTVIIIVL